MPCCRRGFLSNWWCSWLLTVKCRRWTTELHCGHDETVLLVTHNFSSEWIESSKKRLFLRSETPCLPQGCDVKKVPLKWLNECGDDIPIFVFRYSDELLSHSVTLMSVFLGRMKQINDICGMKRILKAEMNACENLRQWLLLWMSGWLLSRSRAALLLSIFEVAHSYGSVLDLRTNSHLH